MPTINILDIKKKFLHYVLSEQMESLKDELVKMGKTQLIDWR